MTGCGFSRPRVTPRTTLASLGWEATRPPGGGGAGAVAKSTTWPAGNGADSDAWLPHAVLWPPPSLGGRPAAALSESGQLVGQPG